MTSLSVGGWGPSVRWRDAPNASGVLRGKEARHFRGVAGVPLLMQAVLVRGKHFNGRQLSGLNKHTCVFRQRDESSSWGSLCVG